MFSEAGVGKIGGDAPPSRGEKMLRAIRDVTNEPIRWVVYSHSHADHIGAASMYPKEAMYIAHKETLARLERTNDISRVAPYAAFVRGQALPLPTLTFDGQDEVKVVH